MTRRAERHPSAGRRLLLAAVTLALLIAGTALALGAMQATKPPSPPGSLLTPGPAATSAG